MGGGGSARPIGRGAVWGMESSLPPYPSRSGEVSALCVWGGKSQDGFTPRPPPTAPQIHTHLGARPPPWAQQPPTLLCPIRPQLRGPPWCCDPPGPGGPARHGGGVRPPARMGEQRALPWPWPLSPKHSGDICGVGEGVGGLTGSASRRPPCTAGAGVAGARRSSRQQAAGPGRRPPRPLLQPPDRPRAPLRGHGLAGHLGSLPPLLWG